MHRIVLIGPQGSGKTTQAKRLAGRYQLQHFSTGDLIREEMRLQTAFGRSVGPKMERGELLPDKDVEQLLFHHLDQPSNGWVLDGYPRRKTQAQSLILHHAPQFVIELHLDDETCIARLSNRRVCSHGHVFHLQFAPPKVADVCDHDGSPLQQRDDDRPESIRQRLAIYRHDTMPAIHWMAWKGVPIEVIPAHEEPDAVAQRIEKRAQYWGLR